MGLAEQAQKEKKDVHKIVINFHKKADKNNRHLFLIVIVLTQWEDCIQMNYNQVETKELVELYDKINAFIKFLDKEEKDAEKIGESNE